MSANMQRYRRRSRKPCAPQRADETDPQRGLEQLEPRLLLSAIPPGTQFAADGMPLLHSDPSAPLAIFLDFQYESRDGQKILFNSSGDPATIDASEQEQIAHQWAKVSASYAMFPVDITTVMPDPAQPFIWAAIYRTPSGPGSGGGARSFGYMPISEYFNQRYSASSGRVEDGLLAQSWIREGAIYTDVITHETGHSQWVNGHESADTEGEKLGIHNLPIESGPFTRSTGPNGSWFNFTTEWTYQSNPNGFFYVLDDLERMTGTIIDDIKDWVDPNYSGDGYRVDDHAGTIAGATAMTWDAGLSSHIGQGVIERHNDTDVLSFAWAGGTAWIGAETALPNPLLDVRIVVKDAAGNVVGAADPEGSKQATLRLDGLAAGTYFVEVAGDGDYSELGKYEITVGTALPHALRPLAHIPMDGQSLSDTSGQGNNGSWIGGSQWTTGPDGSTAARLNGSNRIRVQSSNGDFTDRGVDLMGRTFSMWFKADSVSGGSQKVIFEDPTAPGYRLYVQNGKLKAYAINDAGLSNWRGGITLEAPGTINAGQWYHVALTHRTTFSEVRDTIKLYLDGAEVASGAAGPVPKTSQFYIGSTSFTGAIDDVRIFSEVVAPHLIAEWADNTALSQPAPTGAVFNVNATTTHDTTSLNWAAVPGATGYRILRSLDNQHFALVGTVGAGTTSFDDTGLRGSQSYFYRIDATGGGAVGAAEVLTRAQPIRFVQYTKARNPNPDDFWASKMDVWGHGVDGLYAMMLTFFGPDGHRDTGLRIDTSTDGINFTTLVTLPPGESIYYDNGVNHNGLTHGETYTYRLVPIDDLGPVESAAVILETEPMNFGPNAVDDDVITTNLSVNVQVLANDTDFDEDTLAITGYTQGHHGTVTDNGNGTLHYAFNPGQTTPDSFTYTIEDGFGGQDTATVVVTKAGVNSLGIFTAAQDIGGPGQAGSTVEVGGIYTVIGGGSDIWTTSDEFHYAYRTESGDLEMIARVDYFEDTDDWGKAGIMIRDGLGDDAAHAMILQRPDQQVAFQWRTSAGSSSGWNGTLLGGTAQPKWLKLVRSGNTFSGYYSTNGQSWTQAGSSKTISMTGDVQIGLAVTSHNNSTLATTNFSNVQLAGLAGPPTVASPIANVTVNENAADTVIDLAGVFTDTEDDDQTLVLSLIDNTNPGLAWATLAGRDLTLDYTANTVGTTEITIRATDSSTEFAEDKFTVLVRRVGDTDLDGDVDITDFNTLATNFDPAGANPANDWSKGDFDEDGDVDITDFNAMLEFFNPGGNDGSVSVTSAPAESSIEATPASAAAEVVEEPAVQIRPLRRGSSRTRAGLISAAGQGLNRVAISDATTRGRRSRGAVVLDLGTESVDLDSDRSPALARVLKRNRH